MSGRTQGSLKTAAKRIGVPLAEYNAKRASGLKWCSSHQRWESADGFSRKRRQCRASTRLARRRPCRLSEREVRVMRELRWIGRVPYQSLTRMFGKSHHSVWAACNGRTWSHLPMPGDRDVNH